jgi:tRNA(Ile)-lysidine synthase
MFLDRLSQTAHEACGLDREKPLVVGVSGGVDSLALLDGLHRLGYPVIAVHLDHGLRHESREDARYVQQMAQRWNLPFVGRRVDVRKAASEEGQSIEEAARHARYRFLFEQAREFAAQAVAVAHHADDQVETVLMHFLRGAGLPGLSGMAYRTVLPIWDEAIPLVRPLLSHWRADIEDYLMSRQIRAREDATNWDETYFRNRLRHSLIPELETYNPQIRAVLWRMADVLMTEDAFLSSLAEGAWQRCLVEESSGRIAFDLEAFLKLPAALQRRILRHAVQFLRPENRNLGFEAIERGLKVIRDQTQKGETDLAARLNLTIVGGQIVIKTWASDLPEWDSPLLPTADISAELGSQDELILENGWQLVSHLRSEIPDDRPWISSDPNQVWLDADRLTFPLVVRGRRPGDRWRPLGLKSGTQKLQDFFINEKLPEHLRDRWPLVCSGDEIIWIVGYRPSEEVKITSSTARILHLAVVKK